MSELTGEVKHASVDVDGSLRAMSFSFKPAKQDKANKTENALR
jgi:hypothetical protein